MLNMKQEMNRIILFFMMKHKGHWDKAYNSIRAKDPVTLTEIAGIGEKHITDYISIIDTDYPNNFKQIYMPPLGIFTNGQKSLLNADDEIYSLWGRIDFVNFEQYHLDKQHIYALFYDESQVEHINLLTKANYKFILIEKHNADKKGLNKLSFNDNLVHISEIPPEITHADVSETQNDERMLLGVSKYAVAFEISDSELEKIVTLLEFEKRKLVIRNNLGDSKFYQHPFLSFDNLSDQTD